MSHIGALSRIDALIAHREITKTKKAQVIPSPTSMLSHIDALLLACGEKVAGGRMRGQWDGYGHELSIPLTRMGEIEQAADGQEEPQSALHILRVLPIVVVLGLLVHFVLPRIDTIEAALQTLRTMKPWAVVLAFVMEILSYVANGALLQSIVALMGERISLRRSAAIEIGAGTVAVVAAGALGFGASIYRWTRNSGLSQRTAMLASWLPSVFDSITLVLFGLMSAGALIFHHDLSRTTLIALVIVVSVLLVLIGTIIVLLARNEWLIALSTFAARTIQKVRPSVDDVRFVESAQRAASTWHSLKGGGWIRPGLYSLLVLTFDLLCLRYALLAAGQPAHFTVVLAGYGVPMLLGRASFIPGGIAVTEVAMAAVLSGLSVPGAAAVVAVLIYRLISFWIPSLIGIPIAVTLQATKREARA